MGKHWTEVKDALEVEIDRIWWDEPEEVRMARNLDFPSGAGTAGQALGNLFFLVCDTQALGWWTAEPAMKAALADPTFDVEQCKRMWTYMNLHMAKLMGDIDPPTCPEPWLNMPKLVAYCNDMVEAFESIETKEELADLVWSWCNYVNRLNKWFFLIFPWHLGDQFPVKGPKTPRQSDYR
ncbi:cucumopine synthase-related protein [Chelatococcus asaccharovorans]|uniref:cucumopine synthase-related protein n=1 Tax=Chelatococcus asaccharovorans TaxID=28210 RepID=UPI00224C71FC|nr:hypothetical protein [Chelatococcus asaccharovorans]CAH1668776.1 Cucumopine_C domain-containing protein [Chelatococcus asaccharovorans]CAH1679773.1 Cucumopine_C domain-containing protein [Chelatococcus asaccharovorans]